MPPPALLDHHAGQFDRQQRRRDKRQVRSPEKKSLTGKAMYRAGKAPAAADVEVDFS